MTHEKLVEKVAILYLAHEDSEDKPDIAWATAYYANHKDAEHHHKMPITCDHCVIGRANRFATAAISVVTEEAAKTETTLLTVIADIREALGVGCKPMLTELPEVIRDLRRRIDELDE